MMITQDMGVASFRSRQQVQRFEQALLDAGLDVRTIHTPHEVAIGCGLSVAFQVKDFQRVKQIFDRSRGLSSFVGFYHCVTEGARMHCSSMARYWDTMQH